MLYAGQGGQGGPGDLNANMYYAMNAGAAAGAAGAMFNPAMGMGGPMGMNVGMGGYGPMGAAVGEDGKVCSPRVGDPASLPECAICYFLCEPPPK